MRAVLDTNVIVSAARSDRGRAFQLLSAVGSGRFEISVSVALILEYEHALRRYSPLAPDDVADLLDFLCSVANRQRIFYLWRPFLRHSHDDFILELAVASRSEYLVTFNKRDFKGAAQFGIRVVEPREFLLEIGG